MRTLLRLNFLRLFGLTLCVLVGTCLLSPSLSAGTAEGALVTICDGAGRELRIPAAVKRVYATSPVAIVMLYSLAPDRLIGWNYPLGPAEKAFVLPALRDLPVLGGWFGENGKGNRETLLAAKPDLVLSIGTMDGTAKEFSDRLQSQVGIPVFMASGTLEDTAATFELLGALLGVPERAKVLADYARRSLKEAKAFAAALPKEDRVRVYYAEGLRGLQTDTKGSLHTEVIDYLEVENVVQGQATSGFGRISVSLDQVITWAPEVILVCPEKQTGKVAWTPEWLAGPAWKQVPAVSRQRVYLIPGAPFNWLDRPPSSARLLGLKWLSWVLYPDKVAFDMMAETREFYRLFYWYEMSENEAHRILESSLMKNVGGTP